MKQTIKFLKHAVGTNPARSDLRCINIEVNSGRTILTAANAYIIKQVVHTDVPLENGTYQLSLEAVNQAYKLIKNKSYVELSQNGLLVDLVLIPFTQKDELLDYPDLTSLTDASRYGQEIPFLELGLTAQLLVDVLKDRPTRANRDIIKLIGGRSSGKKQYFDGPIRVEFYGRSNYSAIILPVRINW